jgi:LAO/AO transport system kinase
MLQATKILYNGIRLGKRDALAKAITLIESSNPTHQNQAAILLQNLTENNPILSSQKPTLRVGIAGPPGAGKSTFIEKLGLRFLNSDPSNRIAVIPVDPSSHISGGSILGDKTRMEELSKTLRAYIRASPTRGVLGGIAEHTSDVITLCEYTSFNIVIVESVGLGQSEVDIDGAVDILILVVPPTAGDSLQASKKGIMEAADLILINKADGELLPSAKHTKADYAGALQFIRLKHNDWIPKALLMSAYTGYNLDKVQEEILKYHSIMSSNGYLYEKRSKQAKLWAENQFKRMILSRIENSQYFQKNLDQINQLVIQGKLTPRAAASISSELVDINVRELK